MNQDQLLGLIRHALTTVGGLMIAKGFMDESTMIEVVGAVTTLVGAFWSIMSKKKSA